MPPGAGFRFGPFVFDGRTNTLLRGGAPVALSTRHLALLHALLARAGEILTKDELIEAAWPGCAIGDNSLSQAIATVRDTLDPDDHKRYITTCSGMGYRFSALVEPVQVRRTPADLHALLAPYRALIDGRAALESFSRDQIVAARDLFLDLHAQHQGDATVHVGLANVYALTFESTRAERAPDVEALRLAAVHAHEACCLNVDSGEAWATLGFVLGCKGDRANALAALRRAVAIEPNNWHHWLRLAYGGWGEERLRAAHQTLVLMPGCAMAHWLAATVFCARGALLHAEREVDAGLVAFSAAPPSSTKLRTVALYWLKGLLCLARDDEEAALEVFACELALEPQGHLYARECCAHTWTAIGAVRLRRGDEGAARVAFDEAIARVPSHPLAHAGVALLSAAFRSTHPRLPGASVVDDAIGRAALYVAAGNTDDAVQLVMDAVAAAPAGNAGWRLPIEPLLAVQRDRERWVPVLSVLRERAS